MKSFTERNPLLIGAFSIGGIVLLILVSLNYRMLPFVGPRQEYSAYFAEAGGLRADNPVQVSGVKVGKVSSVGLDGPRVLVKFKLNEGVRLGDRTEAAIKSKREIVKSCGSRVVRRPRTLGCRAMVPG